MAKLLQKTFTMNSLSVFGKRVKNINPKCNKFHSWNINKGQNSSYTKVIKRSENSVENALQPKICHSNIIYRNFITTTSGLKNFYSVTFVLHTGEKHTVKGKEGDSMLDVIKNQDFKMESYGACDGTISCSTCHLIFKEKDFENTKIDSPLTDEEMDILTTAKDCCGTSRLGCQVNLTKILDGVEAKIPEHVNGLRNK